MVGEGGWAFSVFDDDTRCIKPIIKGERFLARFQLCCRGDSEEVKLPVWWREEEPAANLGRLQKTLHLLGAFNIKRDKVKDSCEHKSSQERCLDSTRGRLTAIPCRLIAAFNYGSNNVIYKKLNGEYSNVYRWLLWPWTANEQPFCFCLLGEAMLCLYSTNKSTHMATLHLERWRVLYFDKESDFLFLSRAKHRRLL